MRALPAREKPEKDCPLRRRPVSSAPLMKTAILLIALFAIHPFSTTLRAETLAEMAAKAGTEWMIGKWTSEDGNVSVSYEWKLNKNAVAFTFKMGERESEGMMMRKPGTDQVIYSAADNRGGMSTGTWIEFNGNPTLIATHTNAEGTERKMATEHIKTDDKTMTVKLHAVGSDGKPDTSQSREVVFKRKP